MKMSVASNAGVVALALSLLAGNAWAAPSCARPQDIAALRTAALQQQLMVAALTCGDVDAYNGFVMSHRSELQESDSALMSFFVRRDAQRGVDDYNAYKTWLANDSSLRSLRDPQFCRTADVAFDVAHERRIPVADLASKRHMPLDIGYTSCRPGAPESLLMADATPSLPTRHRALPDSLSSAPAPVLASRPGHLVPPVFPRHDALSPPDRSFDTAQAGGPPPRDNADDSRYAAQPQANDTYQDDSDDRDSAFQDDNARDAGGRGDAYRGNSGPSYSPRNADVQRPRAYRRDNDRYDDNADDSSDDYGNGPTANDGPDSYRDTPDAYGPPASARMVRGRDGHWYLLRSRGD